MSFAKGWNNYRFDRRLRSVVLEGIERVEIATRTKIVNRFASQYGPFAYRNASNFASPLDMTRFTRTLDFIDEETRRSNEEFVAHFRRTYDTSNGMPLWNRHLAIAPGIPNKDPRWHEKRYPIVPHRIYSVLCILKQLIDVIAPQSRWPERLKSLLVEFPDIHRLSMALPTGFEHSLIWK